MMSKVMGRAGSSRCFKHGLAVAALIAITGSITARGQDFSRGRGRVFQPGNLVVSRSVYDNKSSNVTVGEQLPPNCTESNCVTAGYNGLFPYIFNNAPIDGSFGITSRIFLDQITPFGWPVNSLEVPNSLQPWITSKSNQVVTSFSSKSELSLNLSTDHRYLTFIGYVAPVNALDVSNANTPGVIDPTNPVPGAYYRVVTQLDEEGNYHFTETNAYSGDNGRAAILSDLDGQNYYFTAGNAGNGSNPQPTGVVLGAGAQFIDPSDDPEIDQLPGLPTPVGAFSVTELGDKADKVGKDDNYRGLALYDNVLYYSKGSGSNGVDTVYFVDTTGKACPNGVGLPSPSAALPTAPFSAYDPTTGTPTNMCILSGFPTVLAKSSSSDHYPFGIWFANATTVYVADEGDGYTGGTDLYTHAAAQTLAGLQKWVFNSSTQSWTLAYTLQTGLELGVPYTVRGYPTGTNAATGLPWAPATDGLRNLTGSVDPRGVVTIWAITSTVSGNGDTGADPNRLVVIQDDLSNTEATTAAKECFFTLRTAGFAEVLRGVSFTPGTEDDQSIW